MRLDQSPLHDKLISHAKRFGTIHMRDLFEQDPQRFAQFSAESDYLFLDYSKNRIDQDVLDDLLALCEEAGLSEYRERMFSGEIINQTEGREVLHTALRADGAKSLSVGESNITGEIQLTKEKLYRFVEALHTGEHLGYTGKRIDTLVSIGIGGSFLGPLLVNEALEHYAIDGLETHFVANIDGTDLTRVLNKIDIETSLFVIQSKSFKTQETLENALAAKAWFLANGGSESAISGHFVAVSANTSLAMEFGIEAENIFPMWDWVGGRYSLWSAIGLPIIFQIGASGFESLLAGARNIDQHFCKQEASSNLPVLMAVLGVWYNNYLGAETHAVLPYDQYLKQLPGYLQQLDMESNGKSVDIDGEPLTENSGPVIWGDIGCNGQHAYHQLLHQGTRFVPVDFIASRSTHNPLAQHHQHLLANCLAQSQALMAGKTLEQAEQELRSDGYSEADVARLARHKVIAGNKPSNTLVMEALTPESLGALIALYEHKVFVQGVIWGLNSFDQWGVELGKTLETQVYQAMTGQAEIELDSSTQGLIDRLTMRSEV